MKYSILQQTCFAIIILFFLFQNYSYAEIIKYEDWETGNQNNYDVYNYSDLYSVFEDLESDYSELINEYHSLERTIEEQHSEISLLEEEIKSLKSDLKGEQIKYENLTNSNDWLLIFIPILLYSIPVLITKMKRKGEQ